MLWIDLVLNEARESQTLLVVVTVLLLALVARVCAPEERAGGRVALQLLAIHIALLPVVALARAGGLLAAPGLSLATQLCAVLPVILTGASLVFAVALPRVQVRVPRILREILVAAVVAVAFFVLASRAGFNLSGLIATSTVLTAVIGLSFQDTLGNVMAGLALQLDQSVQVGDWIKATDVSGRVTEIRWRSTSVETRNWETVVIPNSVLLRNQFQVLGRRSGQPRLWRRWITFSVDFRFSPSEVIATVTGALKGASIPDVATEPPPECVLMDFGESYARYAVRYWLKDMARDDSTDSVVRTRVYFALKRAHIPLSLPAHAVFLTEESTERQVRKSQAETDRRLAALARVDFFQHLPQAEQDRLAEGLTDAPYASGEVMTRQGDEAHWLYLIVEGQASVHIASGSGVTLEVARLGAGDFFGEMSLMTGAPRSATVVAITDVTCYRLHKAAFQEVLRERPELADQIAEILASRRYRLEAARDGLGTGEPVAAPTKSDLLGRMRQFFGLS